MSNDWIFVKDQKPPERIPVETKVVNKHGERCIQMLVRIGEFWFFPDMSKYVYYEPTHWMYKSEQES